MNPQSAKNLRNGPVGPIGELHARILKPVGAAIVSWKLGELGEMTFGTERFNRSAGYVHRLLPPNAQRQRTLGGAALVSGAALCAWILCSNFAGTNADQIGPEVSRGDKLDLVAPRGDKLIANSPASSVYASLFDVRFSFGSWPGRFANNAPLQNDGNSPPPLRSSLATARNTPDILSTPSSKRVAQNVILPAPRPTLAPTRTASLADSGHGNQTASDTPPAKPSIFVTVFEKLFGKSAPIRLAYAATDDAGLGAVRSQQVDTTSGQLFMIYPPIPFTCRTALSSKPIQVSAVGSTTRTMPMKKCAALLRRISTILNKGKSSSMECVRCG